MKDRNLILVLIASGITLIFIIILLLDQTAFHRERIVELASEDTYNIYASQEGNQIILKKCDFNGTIKKVEKYTLDSNGNIIEAKNEVVFFTKLDAFRYKKRYENKYNCVTIRNQNLLIHDIESEFKNKEDIISYLENSVINNKPKIINKIK